MSASWLTAAERYRNPPTRLASPKTGVEAPNMGPERPPCPTASETSSFATELSHFLKSEDGRAALALLTASKRHIVLGEERPTMGYGSVYFLDGTGLHRSVEGMGMWVAYSRSNTPKITDLSVEEIAREVSSCDVPSAPLGEMMQWIRHQLDKISEYAPS